MPKLLTALGPLFLGCGVLCVLAAVWAVIAGWRGHALSCARRAYLSSIAGGLCFWGVFFVTGAATPRPGLLNPGPFSDLRVTLLCLAAAWLLLGLILFGVGRSPFTAERAAFWLSLVLLTGLCLNLVRERQNFGDVYDFTNAARQLASSEPLHPRYLYPPLLATLLTPLVRAGDLTVFLSCVAANLLAVGLAFVLLRECLMRYGFANLAATLLSFAALVANVALLRTLFYVQTNLHVLNLMLLSLLLYPARLWASALALALASHIKTSPLALALPFLLNRDWKWLGWFGLFGLGIVACTSYFNGFHRYLEYLDNVVHIYRANGLSLRENSLDSLFRASYWAFGWDVERARLPIQITRALLCLLSLWLCQAAIRRCTFSGGASGATARVLDAYPVLMLFLMSVSPLVWEHHPLIILLSMLVMLKQLDNETDAVLWLLAWFLIFLVPTFDLYPFSFRITLGVALAYALSFRLVRRDSRSGGYFRRVHAWLARLGVSTAAAHAERPSAGAVAHLERASGGAVHSERSSAPPVSSK